MSALQRPAVQIADSGIERMVRRFEATVENCKRHSDRRLSATMSEVVQRALSLIDLSRGVQRL